MNISVVTISYHNFLAPIQVNHVKLRNYALQSVLNNKQKIIHVPCSYCPIIQLFRADVTNVTVTYVTMIRIIVL